MATLKHLKAVILDWAGTTVDFGSRAPAFVFQEIFRQRDVPITAAEAREPMGRAKREHIATVAAMPRVAEAWQSIYGSVCSEADVDAMYAEFLPMQKRVLQDHSEVISGIPELAIWLRSEGLKIGSSTGYTQELMTIVAPAAAKQGYAPDCILCSEDAPQGRPAPYLIFEAAKRMDVYPTWHLVKVDDTPVGIQAGRNAGCWTIGITRTGNCVGLSEEEYAALDTNQQQAALDAAGTKMTEAGAHALAESSADIPDILADFDARLDAGELPIR